MQENIDDIPDHRIEDEVEGAVGYEWDPVNKVWEPIFPDNKEPE